MDLVAIQEQIFNLINKENAYDSSIPSDFDFINNTYGIEVKIASSIVDYNYKNEIPLQINIVGLEENKIEILNKIQEIDNIINNADFSNCYIVKSNPFIQTFMDEDKFNCVLVYYINSYK